MYIVALTEVDWLNCMSYEVARAPKYSTRSSSRDSEMAVRMPDYMAMVWFPRAVTASTFAMNASPRTLVYIAVMIWERKVLTYEGVVHQSSHRVNVNSLCSVRRWYDRYILRRYIYRYIERCRSEVEFALNVSKMRIIIAYGQCVNILRVIVPSCQGCCCAVICNRHSYEASPRSP